MNDDDALRGPLVEQVERLAHDLLVGRHGDPHLAFAVFCYPDREPAVVVVMAGHSPFDVTSLKRPKEGSDGSPFPMADFNEARAAMDDAHFGMVIGLHRDEKMDLGVVIREQIEKMWSRRRMAPVERALEQAQYEADRPAVCDYCKRRFTERGLAQHHRLAAVCGRKARGELRADA